MFLPRLDADDDVAARLELDPAHRHVIAMVTDRVAGPHRILRAGDRNEDAAEGGRGKGCRNCLQQAATGQAEIAGEGCHISSLTERAGTGAAISKRASQSVHSPATTPIGGLAAC
jgi:hypothetical protein